MEAKTKIVRLYSKIIITLLSILLLSKCTSYKPLIDTKGRSGAYGVDRAAEITDDIQHCSALANQEIDGVTDSIVWGYNNIFRGFFFWLPPEEKRTRENYTKNCLKGRGHNVIN